MNCLQVDINFEKGEIQRKGEFHLVTRTLSLEICSDRNQTQWTRTTAK